MLGEMGSTPVPWSPAKLQWLLARSPRFAQWWVQTVVPQMARLRAIYEYLCSQPRHVRRRLQRVSGLSLSGLALTLAVVGPPLSHLFPALTAQAGTSSEAILTVSAGASGQNSGDGCSLVEALINANHDDQSGSTECAAGSGADTIVLPSGGTLSYNVAFGTGSALPDVTSVITIQGNGSTIERAAGATSDFRLLSVLAGDLTLRDSTLSGGSASFGGGLFANRSTVSLIHSTLSGNHADDGGGLFADNKSRVLITNSVLSTNTASFQGGGLYSWRSSVGVNNSTLSGNHALGSGGGLSADYYSNVRITDSTLFRNSAGFDGGGLSTWNSHVTVRRSTIANNVAGRYGGGLSSYFSDVSLTSNVSLTNSTLSGNSAGDSGGGLSGGGYDNITLTNSTITGNFANGNGGGISCCGYLGAVHLDRSVVSGNRANSRGNEIMSYTGNIVNSLGYTVLGNAEETSAEAFGGNPPRLVASDYVATSNQHNVPLSSILDTDPSGKPVLTDNGGRTPTVALVPGSPAIDRAPTGFSKDQRRFPRPVDGDNSGSAEFDSGAFEYGSAPPAAPAP